MTPNDETVGVELRRLRGDLASGRLSRDGFFEEIERHLDADEPLEGALDVILEELHEEPDDPHLLRLLARLYERDGDAQGARRALSVTGAPRARRHPKNTTALTVGDQLLVARVLLHVGDADGAERLARQAAQAAPNSLSALSLLAKICHVQGRLTETLRLWQRIHVAAPQRETALEQLAVLDRLARDKKRARQRFVAVGDFGFARKPAVQIDFERAFTRFRARDFQGAIALADQTAESYSGKSPQLFKLAVLQRAWLQERTGDLDGARATLLQLGRVKGFETDVDRLSLLARVCEAANTPETRRQALLVFEHLDRRHAKLSALPHLASLHAVEGDLSRAAAFAREYQRRFERRMQRPTAAEVVRARVLTYIPLTASHPLPLAVEDDEAIGREIRVAASTTERRRLRALAACVAGNRALAGRILSRLVKSRSARPADFAYLGDLAVLEGDTARALARYTEALHRSEGMDVRLWRQTLSTVHSDGGGLKVPDSAVHASIHQALRDAAHRSPGEPGAWHVLAAFERSAGLAEEAGRHDQKARDVEQALGRASDIGRVLAASVYSLNGKQKGLVHEVLACRQATRAGSGGRLAPRGVLGNVSRDLTGLVGSVLATVKDYARARWPHLTLDADDYVYTLKIAKDDQHSSGPSAGLPIAIAFLSVMLRRPSPPDACLSGVLVCDARTQVAVHRIGDASAKIKGACHRDLAKIVLPADNEEDVKHAAVIPAAVERALVTYARNLDDAVTAVWSAAAWEW